MVMFPAMPVALKPLPPLPPPAPRAETSTPCKDMLPPAPALVEVMFTVTWRRMIGAVAVIPPALERLKGTLPRLEAAVIPAKVNRPVVETWKLLTAVRKESAPTVILPLGVLVAKLTVPPFMPLYRTAVVG